MATTGNIPASAVTRVRFAPSPTGHFHIGSARTALFNWLYARHTGGIFVLRVEDTDRARNTPEALQALLDGLRWLGLDWDEGPEKGGAYGPYFQSERDAIYGRHLEQLLSSGRAYELDGAVYFRVEGERETVYDSYKGAEVVKVKAPPLVIEDAVRGRVEKTLESDFVLRRSNGDFGFHFVNVVDDLTMGITHVIRGEDHLSNTPRHLALFHALGAAPPVYAHIPLILKSDGRGKMSKRETGALLDDYRRRHYLPEAVRNFLCLLGWNPKDNSEVMPIDEIIGRFDFAGIQKDGARFDEQKLDHINATWLRSLPVETFVWNAAPVLAEAGLVDEDTDEDYLRAVLELCQPKIRSLEGLAEMAGCFFAALPVIDPQAQAKVLKKDPALNCLREAAAALNGLDAWTAAEIEHALEALAVAKGRRKFDYYPVLRLATTGQGGGPDLLPVLEVLGAKSVRDRIEYFLKSHG